MRSQYLVFPEPHLVSVMEETVDPPAPGKILCRARKSLISIGTETYCLRGDFDPGTNWGEWVQYPFRPGYSMAAEIVALGQGVTGVEEGQRVAAWMPHQELFEIPPQAAYPIPDSVSDEDATWMCLATTTQVAVRRAEHSLGEYVGVVGLGMLGQLIVQYLLLSGAQKIICIDPVSTRLEMAKAHGATDILPINAGDAREEIAYLTGGNMLDVVYDVTGHPAVLASCIPLVRKLGRIVLVGDTPNPTQQRLAPGVVSESLAILGIHGSMTPEHPSEFNRWTRREVIALFYDYLQRGQMRVSDLITHHHKPSDAPQVYADITQDRSSAMGIVFDWM